MGLSLGLDLQGGGHLVYQANLTDPETGAVLEVSEDQMESLKRAIERRVNSAGLGEPIIQILGDDRLLVQLPGVTDLQRAKDLIGRDRKTGVQAPRAQCPQRSRRDLHRRRGSASPWTFCPSRTWKKTSRVETETESEDEAGGDRDGI